MSTDINHLTTLLSDSDTKVKALAADNLQMNLRLAAENVTELLNAFLTDRMADAGTEFDAALLCRTAATLTRLGGIIGELDMVRDRLDFQMMGVERRPPRSDPEIDPDHTKDLEV